MPGRDVISLTLGREGLLCAPAAPLFFADASEVPPSSKAAATTTRVGFVMWSLQARDNQPSLREHSRPSRNADCERRLCICRIPERVIELNQSLHRSAAGIAKCDGHFEITGMAARCFAALVCRGTSRLLCCPRPQRAALIKGTAVLQEYLPIGPRLPMRTPHEQAATHGGRFRPRYESQAAAAQHLRRHRAQNHRRQKRKPFR